MAAELPIDDEVAHGNMPAKGTKVAKLVATAKGFLPECKVQDFPPEPEMACMKMAMDGHGVQAGSASKPEKRLTKKTPQPAEGSTVKEPSQPSQPAKAIAEENSQPKIMLAEAVDSSQSMAESETASQISLQEISSSCQFKDSTRKKASNGSQACKGCAHGNPEHLGCQLQFWLGQNGQLQ
ncbi:unnamed protein product [Cladocopium goreaui]|uniref:Uncharacterized protein n=1 Tax=Cladocopium goreaui TaxID=2562237 RepID=A0A9P1GC28_9DINO|nr:unnamed protein product [Cladocopium goreaui]